MVDRLETMVSAAVITGLVIYLRSGPVATLSPSAATTMLALHYDCYGVALVADGFDFHIPRGYIYLVFAGAVELFNVLAPRNHNHSERCGRPAQAHRPSRPLLLQRQNHPALQSLTDAAAHRLTICLPAPRQSMARHEQIDCRIEEHHASGPAG